MTVNRIVKTTQMKLVVPLVLLSSVQAVSSNARMVRVYSKPGDAMVISTAVITQMR